jgi:hypothetical protein
MLADKLRGFSGGRRFGYNRNGFHARTVSVDLSSVKNERNVVAADVRRLITFGLKELEPPDVGCYKL